MRLQRAGGEECVGNGNKSVAGLSLMSKFYFPRTKWKGLDTCLFSKAASLPVASRTVAC